MNERHRQEAASNARLYADHRQNQRLSEIAAAIRTRRLQLRMTQAEVAARAGIPQPHLSRMETGRAGTPTIAVLDRIAFALGLTFIAQFDKSASSDTGTTAGPAADTAAAPYDATSQRAAP